jgi:hypothetical protein
MAFEWKYPSHCKTIALYSITEQVPCFNNLGNANLLWSYDVINDISIRE